MPCIPALLRHPQSLGRRLRASLAGLGFAALATSSGAAAGVLGRRDGELTRDEALAHARAIVQATDLPVAADLENGFGDAPADAALTIRLAGDMRAGRRLDRGRERRRRPAPLRLRAHAVERIAAAVEAARALPFPFTLTARCENFLRGKPDLDDTIARLQAYEKAGADVLFAPALPDLAAVRAVCAAWQAGELHGRHQGKSFSVAELRGGRRAPHQPGDLAVPRGHGWHGAGRGRGEGQGTFGYVERL